MPGLGSLTRLRVISQPDQVKFYLCIAALTRPQIERSRGDFVDERRRAPELREIDSLNIMLAGVTGFNANVIVFRRVEISEPGRAFFPATGADDSPERPRRQTG